jgi:dihydrolipoamide dehydrogenase
MVYKTKHLKPRIPDYDIIVIGTGSGGGVAAHELNKKGKKVAVIEQEKMGGECPNFGCIPTKALLQAAETLRTIKKAPDFGIKNVGNAEIDYPALKAWKDKAVWNTGTHEGEKNYKEDGIAVIKGHAHFIDPWTISVGNKRYTANKFLIASGTHDVVPPIAGLVETGYIGYREALELEKPPKKLFIIGGGAIGCEFTEIFSTFGVQVHIAEFAERLLSKEDPEVGELVQALFESKGVQVHVDSKVVKVEKKGSQKIVTVETHGKHHQITVDEIMLAAGKAPNTDLGLGNAQVAYDRNGITVSDEMQTSAAHIYAAGDVTGRYMFTHVANYQSRIAANNMTSNLKHVADYRAVPRCVFISPEVATVGMTEAELKQKGIKYQVGAVSTGWLGRANTSQEDTGFVKILANQKGVILGASIIAPRAGEMIHELTLAIQYRMKASKIVYTIHAFPTWNQAIRSAATKIKCR